jgi:hypothetical protein
VCYLNCPNGKYGSRDLEGEYCLDCPSHCAECRSSSECTVCKADYVINNNYQCVISCPGGSIAAVIRGADVCIKTPHCKRARVWDWDYYGYYCEECDDNYVKSNSICVKNCSIGFFDNPKTDEEECISCTAHCSSCQSLEYCDTCEDGFTFSLGKCVRRCDDGKFGAIINQEDACEECPLTCSKCSGTFACTECKKGYGLTLGQCGLYVKMVSLMILILLKIYAKIVVRYAFHAIQHLQIVVSANL